ncbi:MAG: dethiobiotin synthase [Chitinophagales bacterium]
MNPQFPQTVFVTGIGTNVGKTIAAAVLVEALQADYWKPVQTGSPPDSDTQIVSSLISNQKTKTYPEAYVFSTPSSPHHAAAHEGKEIDLHNMPLPITANRLILEGAGGLLVPLNGNRLMADYITMLQMPVIVVVRNYLGSINHTLLTLENLQLRNIPVAGLVFNGDPFLDNEAIIQQFSYVNVLGHIAEATTINKEFVAEQAALLRQSIQKHYVL